ncbi:MAG: RNA-binding cell elongation regulator Jag/EloR [Ardenticatenia bacterium]|nr:RNA-binding cell elongation regulator Jag/EloR [Ardenticatenia bacterium]
MGNHGVVRGKSVEASGRTVEEAVDKALARLNRGRDEVEIEVLREPSSGILGFGARDAIVRVTELVPVPAEEQVVDVVSPPSHHVSQAPESPRAEPEGEPSAPPSRQAILELSRELLVELLTRMHVIADVQAYWAEPETPNEEATLVLDIVGDDLGLLIGRRGSTLREIQFLMRLMVGRRLGQRVNLVVDVEGYKRRRAETLRALALEKAEQVRRTGRPVYLRPMQAYERRIVHLALRNEPGVITRSTGEEPRRRVGIFPA